MRNRIIASLALLVMILTAANGAFASADAYPSKPIKLLCGYAAGGSSDILCRILADRLGKKLNQAVVVENISGAGGWVMWNQLIKQTAPDGYTFALVNTPNYNMGKYDTANPREYDLTAIDLLANHVSDYNVIAIRPEENRFTDFASLIEYAKANVMLVGASAVGIMNDDSTIAERLNKDLGTQIQTVTTTGAKDNETFLLNGSTDMLIAKVGVAGSNPVFRSRNIKGSGDFLPNPFSLLYSIFTAEKSLYGNTVFWRIFFCPPFFSCPFLSFVFLFCSPCSFLSL